MYNYALMVPESLIVNLTELHFTMVPAALLRCPPRHFGRIASLAAGFAYSKVALVVHCYLGATNEAGKVPTQIAGVSAVCTGIPKSALQLMNTNPDMLKRTDISHMYAMPPC